MLYTSVLSPVDDQLINTQSNAISHHAIVKITIKSLICISENYPWEHVWTGLYVYMFQNKHQVLGASQMGFREKLSES